MSKLLDEMSFIELWSAMLKDGEFEEGHIEIDGGYSGPAWVHKNGTKPSIQEADLAVIRQHLALKGGA